MGRKGDFQKRHKTRQKSLGYQLPGVGEGLVDPDFDMIEDAEKEAVEGVLGHGRSEDYD